MIVCIYAPRPGFPGRPAIGEVSCIVSAASEAAALTAAKAVAPAGLPPSDMDRWTSFVLDTDGAFDAEVLANQGDVFWFGDAWTLRGDRRGQ